MIGQKRAYIFHVQYFRPEPRPSGFSDRPAAEPKKQQRKYNEQVKGKETKKPAEGAAAAEQAGRKPVADPAPNLAVAESGCFSRVKHCKARHSLMDRPLWTLLVESKGNLSLSISF
eukprot:s5369_g3.t1